MDKKPIIKLNNVTAELGGRVILSNVNIEINQGEFIVVLGPNGSGKSTLLQLILGLLKPRNGNISVFGNDALKGNSNIGYSPQIKPYDVDIPITGRDYVGLGLINNKIELFKSHKSEKNKINSILEELDILSLAEKTIGKMSGGEQQRISLAQALVNDPHLLLLDEPLANLDLSYQSEILERLSNYHKLHNHTILLVAHDVNPLLPYIDKVIYLANTHARIGLTDEVITEESLTQLYGLPVKVFDVEGRIFVAAFDGIIH